MTYLLDTNVCIKYLNGQNDTVRNHIKSLQPNQIVLCSIVKAELIYGAMKSKKSKKNLMKIQNFTSYFESFSFDDKSAELYGQIRAVLEKAGTPIGPNDLLIASIAKANNLTLITHNLKEFSRIKNLNLEDWEK